jgi:hypothetical protein
MSENLMVHPMVGAPGATPAAVEASGLRKSFGNMQAVDGVDLHIRPGSSPTPSAGSTAGCALWTRPSQRRH